MSSQSAKKFLQDAHDGAVTQGAKCNTRRAGASASFAASGERDAIQAVHDLKRGASRT
jgi:hypothetical protein